MLWSLGTVKSRIINIKVGSSSLLLAVAMWYCHIVLWKRLNTKSLKGGNDKINVRSAIVSPYHLLRKRDMIHQFTFLSSSVSFSHLFSHSLHN